MRTMETPRRSGGFSLIELMIAVAIVAIIGAIAVPSYKKSMQKGRRADSYAALLDIQARQERWRSNNTTYSSNLGTDLGYSGKNGSATASPDGYYTLSVTGASATAYTVTATATGVQAEDTDCPTIVLTQNGPDTSTDAKKKCWNK